MHSLEMAVIIYLITNKECFSMTRVSKQEERRHSCPKKRHRKKDIGKETVSVKPSFKEHENALVNCDCFIPKIK